MEEEPTPQPSKTPEEPTEEKLAFLKREEVKTMAKDIAKIREARAKQQQERIAHPQKKIAALPTKPEVVLSQQPLKEVPGAPKKPLVPRRSLKPKEKLFIRLVIAGILLFLVFNAVAFGFWHFFKKNEVQKAPPQETQEEAKITPPPPEPKPAPVAPPAPTFVPVPFFAAPEQELILTNKEELLLKVQEFLLSDLSLNFTNLTFKIDEDALSLDEFLDGAQITVPKEIKKNLKENFMLFSYATEEKKRLGFILEFEDTQGISELMIAWEQAMEKDMVPFFSIIGGKGAAYTSLFRSTTYEGIPVRFQTFSVIDFGIVYSIIDNKLVLTSSLETFQRTADLLKAI